MKPKATLYEELVTITADYLGPAATRFVDRQVQNHLNKQPEKITIADLGVFIDWARISLAVITAETAVVQEYTRRLQALKRRSKKK